MYGIEPRGDLFAVCLTPTIELDDVVQIFQIETIHNEGYQNVVPLTEAVKNSIQGTERCVRRDRSENGVFTICLTK